MTFDPHGIHFFDHSGFSAASPGVRQLCLSVLARHLRRGQCSRVVFEDDDVLMGHLSDEEIGFVWKRAIHGEHEQNATSVKGSNNNGGGGAAAGGGGKGNGRGEV